MAMLFYVVEPVSQPKDVNNLPSDYICSLWRPSWKRILPMGMSRLTYRAWWLFHHCHIFSNREYGILVIYCGQELVHYSGIFPSYSRFPFMEKNDLQIGDTWTHPSHRGRGLATFAIKITAALCGNSRRRIWYLVEEENHPSVRAVEKAGFTCIGRGRRTKRFGLKILGSYVLETSEPKV